MVEILLLGVIHNYQREHPYPILLKDRFALFAEQKALYGRWVREHVKNFGPELIFDEMNLREKEEDNRLRDTGVLWVYMDIPEEVREKFGLSRSRSPGSEWLAGIDEPREDYWLLVIEKMSEACKLKKVLVLCGAAHLGSFGNKLKRSGHQVEVRDLRNEPWVDYSWIPGKAL
jgi:hypothetical protein